MPNQAKQIRKNSEVATCREVESLKLKTQLLQLKQPQKTGFPLTIGRIEHGSLEHPSAKRTTYYPICYTCSWHSPNLFSFLDPALVYLSIDVTGALAAHPQPLRFTFALIVV